MGVVLLNIIVEPRFFFYKKGLTVDDVVAY